MLFFDFTDNLTSQSKKILKTWSNGVDDCMVKAISPQPWDVAADTKK